MKRSDLRLTPGIFWFGGIAAAVGLATALGACSDDPALSGAVDLDGGVNNEQPDAEDGPEDADGDPGQDTSPEDRPDAAEPDAGPEATPEPDVEVECLQNSDCDDGIFCNGAERCFEGQCFASPQPPCVDSVDCTADLCDDVNQQCVFITDDSLCAPGQVCDPKAGCFTESECRLDVDCDDGLVCNGAETCVANTCRPGIPLDCDDGVACSTDGCDEETGACQSVPDHTLCLPTELCNLLDDCTVRPPCTRDDDCDDASFCNGVETCDSVTGLCIPGAVPVVDDEIPCTVDACSEQRASVIHTPNAARCADGLFCNGAEICHPVQGCQPGTPPALSDGVGCTVDSCSEVRRTITHTPTDELCEDGLFCNGAETCDPEEGCLDGQPPTLDDLIACTDDRCDEANDRVVHAPNDAACSNGLFCDGQEICDPERGCTPGLAPLVADAFACTADSCDEASDRVVHAPNDAACSNDLFCDGDELCDPGRGCIPGPPRVLDDTVGCTIDACDEVNDRISHTPNNAVCSNGLFCDGQEICDPFNDCRAGVPPNLNDTIPCTVDTCDEANDRVVNAPNNAVCSNNVVCDGQEICQPGVGCAAGAPPADGFVCLTTPRSICLARACGSSRCGDGFIDQGLGETCDDRNNDPGDGCDASCHTEIPSGPVYPGTYNTLPSLPYTCAPFGITVISYNITNFVFSVGGDTLTVAARPIGTPNITMTQTPAPTDGTFDVSVTIPGTCDETYRLAGQFITDNIWTGSFSRTLSGFCFECTSAIVDPVRGTRR